MSAIDFSVLRIRMVDNQLRTTEVTNHTVLAAFQMVPRELFVPSSKLQLAYLDADIDIGNGRYMMSPSPLAKLIQLADIKSGDHVLVVGSGAGYGAAIIGKLARSVVALEESVQLSDMSSQSLSAAGIGNVEVVTGDLSNGWQAKAPFDVIFVEGSVDTVPEAFFSQLAEGGRLVAVRGLSLTGIASVHTKSGKTVSARRAFNLAIKPLQAFQKAEAFNL